MSDDPLLERIKAELARVLPGLTVGFFGLGIIAVLGMILLTELPAYARAMLSDFSQPWRSLGLLFVLGVPLIVLCVCGKRVMGYILTHVGNRGRTDEA